MKIKILPTKHLKEGKMRGDSAAERQNITKFVGDDRAFFTMSDVGRLGLYPLSSYNTPLGVYAYQLDADHFFSLKRDQINKEISLLSQRIVQAEIEDRDKEELEKHKKEYKEALKKYNVEGTKYSPDKFSGIEGVGPLPFRHDAPLIHFFLADWNKLLDLDRYTEKQLEDDLVTLRDLYYDVMVSDAMDRRVSLYEYYIEEIEGSKNRKSVILPEPFSEDHAELLVLGSPYPSQSGNPGAQIWAMTRSITQVILKKQVDRTRKWASILSKDLGYDGVRDPGLGIIYSSEPYQTVFFPQGKRLNIVPIITLKNGKFYNKHFDTSQQRRKESNEQAEGYRKKFLNLAKTTWPEDLARTIKPVTDLALRLMATSGEWPFPERIEEIVQSQKERKEKMQRATQPELYKSSAASYNAMVAQYGDLLTPSFLKAITGLQGRDEYDSELSPRSKEARHFQKAYSLLGNYYERLNNASSIGKRLEKYGKNAVYDIAKVKIPKDLLFLSPAERPPDYLKGSNLEFNNHVIIPGFNDYNTGKEDNLALKREQDYSELEDTIDDRGPFDEVRGYKSTLKLTPFLRSKTMYFNQSDLRLQDARINDITLLNTHLSALEIYCTNFIWRGLEKPDLNQKSSTGQYHPSNSEGFDGDWGFGGSQGVRLSVPRFQVGLVECSYFESTGKGLNLPRTLRCRGDVKITSSHPNGPFEASNWLERSPPSEIYVEGNLRIYGPWAGTRLKETVVSLFEKDVKDRVTGRGDHYSFLKTTEGADISQLALQKKLVNAFFTDMKSGAGAGFSLYAFDNPAKFFINDKEAVVLARAQYLELEKKYEQILKGVLSLSLDRVKWVGSPGSKTRIRDFYNSLYEAPGTLFHLVNISEKSLNKTFKLGRITITAIQNTLNNYNLELKPDDYSGTWYGNKSVFRLEEDYIRWKKLAGLLF